MKFSIVPRLLWLTLFLCMATCAATLGDTIILKSGEKVEGKVIKETATEVTILVKVTASITDERVVPKGDVVKVEKEALDLVAWQTLRNTKPGTGSLPAASYGPIVANLQAFVDQYGQSTHAAEAKELLAAFTEEKRRVDGGEVKIQDRWLAKEEAQKERYQINGQLILAYLQDQARKGDVVGALNSFDQLEKTYPGARAFPDAVDTVKQILPSLAANAGRSLATLQGRMKERELMLSQTGEAQRTGMQAAFERDDLQTDAAFEAAGRGGQTWPPMVPQSAKSLEALAAKAREEQQRLAALPVADMRRSIQMTEKAKTLFASKDFEGAEKELTEAVNKWNANEVATRLQPELAAARSSATETASADEKAAAEKMEADATTKATEEAATAAAATAAEESAALTEGTPAEETASEEPSRMPFIIGGLVLFIFGLVAYNAYRKRTPKEDEIIE